MTIRTLLLTAVACCCGLQRLGALTQAQLDPVLHTTVMVRAVFNGETATGAGIVFGRDRESIYIATARHVVVRGDSATENVEILFRGTPDSWQPATVVERSDPGLDLALIRTTAAIDPCTAHLEQAADTKALSRGDQIFPVGYPNGVEWGVPATPGRIGRLDAGQIIVESAFLAAGHSGGPLLTDAGRIAGMLQSDAGPFGRALAIGRLLDRLREWGYPVMLREPKIGATSALHVAAENDDAAAVERELDACADVEARDARGETPLHKAAARGHVIVATRLLERGADVDVVSDARRTIKVRAFTLEERQQKAPLHLAIEARASETALLLIAKGARPDVKSFALEFDGAQEHLRPIWAPAITLAIEQRLSAVAKALIDKGADVNATVDTREFDAQEIRSVLWRSPVRAAIDHGLPDVLDWLIRAGAKTDESLLWPAVDQSCDADEQTAVAMLESLRRSTPFSKRSLNEALERAIRNVSGGPRGRRPRDCFSAKVFEFLIATGADVNARDASIESSPLDVAAIVDAVPAAALLIAHGAKVDRRNILAETALHQAALYGSPGVASLLAKHGAGVDVRTFDNGRDPARTPLQTVVVESGRSGAALSRRLDTARVLLEAGADPNQRGWSGQTLLRTAAAAHDGAPFVELLLQFRANPNIADTEDGQTPLHAAATGGFTAAAALLLNRGAAIDATSKHGLTPLWMAIERVIGGGGPAKSKAALQVAQYLVEKGAGVNVPAHDTYTMLDHAVSRHDFETARFLIDNGATGSKITMERLAAALR